MSAAPSLIDSQVFTRALDARDPRFDGVFFVGVTTTRIYCRPVCPSRRARQQHRRFFASAAAAESAGFRPCLRCRPELAPGRAICDAMSRLASTAIHRISAGALNDRSVADLATELGVSERHLRRAMEREIGVSPLELAQTHRLLLAKQLLAETRLSVTTIAFASGFQSLRRFNAIFRERYRMNPSSMRRARRSAAAAREQAAVRENEIVQVTLGYRPPLAWDALVALFRRDAIAGVEMVQGRTYARTARVDGRSGVIIAEDAKEPACLKIGVSLPLLPSLMPLLVRLRDLFDLDAEPTMVDACLEQGGLQALVRRRRGLRIPGALDAFELILRAMLIGSARPGAGTNALSRRVVAALGERIETGVPLLTHLPPGAERVAEAGPNALRQLGVPRRRAEAITAAARLLADGALRLAPGQDTIATRDALMAIDGVDDRLATTLVMRAVRWPDAFPASDGALQRAAGVPDVTSLLDRAEQWRPWRAYAALHLWMEV